MPRTAVVIALSLGAGLVTGLMFVSMFSGGLVTKTVLSYTLPLPLFTAGLALGAAAAGLAAVAGAVLVAALLGLMPGGVFLLGVGLPVAWLCRQALLWRAIAPPAADGGEGAAGVDGGATVQDGGNAAREWYPPGLLLTWLTVLCGLLVAAVFLWFAGAEGGLRGALARQLELAATVLARQMPALVAGEGEAALRARLRFGAEIMPASMAAMWMMVMLANGCLAQWGVTRMGRNQRPGARFRDLRLPPPLAIALAVALGLALLPDSIGHFGGTLAAILALPYLVAGLVVVHTLTLGRGGRPLLLGVAYLGLFTIYWFSLPLVLLGLADQLFDLRGRFGRPAV